MARGKVQIRRLVNPVDRQGTFCKRRIGLLKKANELSVLCDSDVGVMVFSSTGQMYELATNGNMQGLIERFNGSNKEARGESSKQKNPQVIQQEVQLSRHEIDKVQKSLRYLYGSMDINHMNPHELHGLENNLEIWARNIRSTKMQIMSRDMEVLTNKIIEQNETLDTRSNKMIPQLPLLRTLDSGH